MLFLKNWGTCGEWEIIALGMRLIFNEFYLKNGAQKRTRTSTSLRILAPEASASTNSAIWARGSEADLSLRGGAVNAKTLEFNESCEMLTHLDPWVGKNVGMIAKIPHMEGVFRVWYRFPPCLQRQRTLFQMQEFPGGYP